MLPLEAQRAARRKLQRSARPARGAKLPPALFFTDPDRTPDPVATAGQLPAGWGVVYRHFGAPDRLKIARALASVCRRRRLRLLIAADPVLARKVGADGVHWPSRGLAGFRTAGRFPVETASAHSNWELVRARGAGMDAAVLSAVFPSRSKSAGKPLGTLRFRLAIRATGMPAYALGGVTPANAARVSRDWASLVAGWAAVDAIEGVFGA